MKRLAPVTEIALAVIGVIAVLVMGGGWALVVLVAFAAAVTAWRIAHRSAPTVDDVDDTTAPDAGARSRGRDRHRVRTFRQQQRHDLWRVARSIVAVIVVWDAISFFAYVIPDNGDTASERAATWARDNHLGGVVDELEAHLYDTPPSKTPAKHLLLAGGVALPSPAVGPTPLTTAAPTIASATASTAASTTGSTIPSVAAATPTTAVAATAPAGPTATVAAPVAGAIVAPADLKPLITPALAGEGTWSVIARAGGQDAMWATSIRPLPAAGAVVASMVVIDQTHLRAGLFNGHEEPGGTWARGDHVPQVLQPALVAAMNGGFRFEHIKGGYKTEGVTVKPLREGDATLAIAKDGHMVIGQLGRDLSDDGSWISLRQNLVLMVDHGQSQVERGIQEGVWWGADYGNAVYVLRSAVCQLADGRLAYVVVGQVDATQLADSLINVGCVEAMQMDINGSWPAFFTYSRASAGSTASHFLDSRMGGDPNRYLTSSTKEFFAFFDSTVVPPGSVLDD
ncbi:MAG: hypothetical protein JWM34_194 [Ilumatobacteraceae bacterium]|nr:hypothetical protein [Ilumatobacteraceae bacterium]